MRQRNRAFSTSKCLRGVAERRFVAFPPTQSRLAAEAMGDGAMMLHGGAGWIALEHPVPVPVPLRAERRGAAGMARLAPGAFAQ